MSSPRLLLPLLFAVAICPVFAQEQRELTPREKVTAKLDVEYGTAGDVKLKLDTFVPKEPKSKKLPCLVWIHGGGWEGGNKSSGRGLLTPFVATGEFVGVSVGYRLTGVAPWPAQIHDCKAAIRWIRAHADELGIDPDKIGVWGASAGGHLVAMLGTSGDVKEVEGDCGSPDCSSRVCCVCDYFGPTDFVGYEGYVAASEKKNGAIYKLFGGSVKDKMDLAKQASPVNFVTKDDPPFLFLHGTKDPLVPLSQSEALDKKLKEAGVDSKLIVIHGAGHGFGGEEINKRVSSFFARHLQGKEVTVDDTAIGTPAKE
jgi:acetyl esterase/lipase